MRQHSKTPTLFDGFLGVVGAHRSPNHCDREVEGGCLQLPRGQPHQFSYDFQCFLYTFLTDQSQNLKNKYRTAVSYCSRQLLLCRALRDPRSTFRFESIDRSSPRRSPKEVEVGSCMRQHSKPPSLFDGVLGFVGSHTHPLG